MGMLLVPGITISPLDWGFPSLTVLTVSGCPRNLSKLFDDENFPSHIRSLEVEHMRCTDEPGPIYRKIVTKCPAVVEFVLHDCHVDTYSPFSSLRPFLSFKLVSLAIKPYHELTYNAVEIEDLVRSLPFIEHLDLGSRAQFVGSALGNFTFDHLPLFSRYCPNLIRLAVQLDASRQYNPSPPNLIPFATLRELNLGFTFAFRNMPVECVDGVGTLLSRLLPSHCEVAYFENDPEYDSEGFVQAMSHMKKQCGRKFRFRPWS
ncbi:hypothetical protein H0H92_009690 [Tricholoma furcatifolium]|nr:hypothetical protein H0H92_009690 [Tricholoma furcatifolium]